MLDMSWGEVMLIGGVALIVIGPKDLPKALRTVGQVTTKLRRMAGEFQMQFNEAIREAELDEVRKEVDGIRTSARSASAFNPVQTIRDELKGAVEGRTGARTANGEGEPMGPHRPEAAPTSPQAESTSPPAEPEPPQVESQSLADATAQLKAEQGASPVPAPAHAAGEPPLPVPGSVDDPFGAPPEPAAQNGVAAR